MWDIFISHASEDKASVARPLADLLRQKGISVWIDETELNLGDSLRVKIDQGLAQSRFGLVIVSRAFLSKRWPIQELNGLVARESAGQKIVLPIWHGVDHQTIAQHSPILADRLAEDTANGLERVADRIAAVVTADKPETRKQRRLQRFITDLNLPDAQDRLIAISALRQMHSEAAEATLPLLRAATDPNSTVRDSAKETLKAIGDAAVKPLAEALRSQENAFRVAACEALSAIGPAAAPAIPVLVQLLTEGDQTLQDAARSALRNVGSAAIPALVEMLDGPPPAALQGIFALFWMGRELDGMECVTPAIVRLLQHTDPRVRLVGTLGLNLLPSNKDQATPALISAPQ